MSTPKSKAVEFALLQLDKARQHLLFVIDADAVVAEEAVAACPTLRAKASIYAFEYPEIAAVHIDVWDTKSPREVHPLLVALANRGHRQEREPTDSESESCRVWHCGGIEMRSHFPCDDDASSDVCRFVPTGETSTLIHRRLVCPDGLEDREEVRPCSEPETEGA